MKIPSSSSAHKGRKMNSTRNGCCSAASVAMLPETKNATAENSRENTNAQTGCSFPLSSVNMLIPWPFAPSSPSEIQTLGCNLKIQRLTAVLANGVFHPLARTLLDQRDDAAAAAGAANLRRPRSVRHGRFHQLINQRGGDAGRVRAAQIPFFADQPLDIVPLLGGQAPDAWPGRCARSRRKLWITCLSPLMCCLNTSQLLMPDCRGAPV